VLSVIRHFDLVVLAIALPLFLAAGFPIAGYLVGGGAWLLQRGVQLLIARKAAGSDDPRTFVGLIAGSMILRGWLVAIAVFTVGITVGDKAGLAAAVLFLALFTVYFTINLILRPFDEAPQA